jgi:Ca2+-transporting ATPase
MNGSAAAVAPPVAPVTVISSLVLQGAVIHVPVLQRAFSTVSLSAGDRLYCAAVGSSVLWLAEIGKLIARATRR